MKYISLDVETTCLKPKAPEHLLQVAMVFEDTENPLPIEELPYFCCFIKAERYEGEDGALAMNGWIFSILSGKDRTSPHPVLTRDSWVNHAQTWLDLVQERVGDSGKLNLAGKNVGVFDFDFLPECLQKRFSHRIIDVGSVFVDWSKPRLPSLGDIIGHGVAHDALADAREVIKALRRTYRREQVGYLFEG